jgi:hypothetical protein
VGPFPPAPPPIDSNISPKDDGLPGYDSVAGLFDPPPPIVII